MQIGWVDGTDLYLEPEASFAEAQNLARIQGDSVPVTKGTLHKRLKDKGLLVSTEPGKLLTRRTFDRKRRYVLHVQAAALSAREKGESGEQGEDPGGNGDSCPYPSPYSAGPGQESGHEKGQGSGESQADAPIPPIAPNFDAPGGEPPANNSLSQADLHVGERKAGQVPETVQAEEANPTIQRNLFPAQENGPYDTCY